jgi:hypothetical protein
MLTKGGKDMERKLHRGCVMKTLSLKKLKDIEACDDVIEWFKRQGTTDINKLAKAAIADKKFYWAIWTATRIMTKKQNVQLAVFCAERCLKIYEDRFPDDDRPRKAIEAARNWIKNPSYAAWAAASAAASAANDARVIAWATSDAASDAAKAAAWIASDASASAWASTWADARAASDVAWDAARAAARTVNDAAWAANDSARAASDVARAAIIGHAVKIISKGKAV